MSHAFRLYQDGQIVASVGGNDRLSVIHEILHYWQVYKQDGPCEIVSRQSDGRWPKPRGEATTTIETWTTCRIGSCHRHRECMYRPCRA